MREVSLTDPMRPYEKVFLLYTEAGPEDLGEFTSLQGTSWEGGIRVVSAESLAHALHGYLPPLLRELGPAPQKVARCVEEEEGLCKLSKSCIDYTSGYCRPGGVRGSEQGPPGCWEPPLAEGSSLEENALLCRLAGAWREGRHVLAVRGEGFNVG